MSLPFVLQVLECGEIHRDALGDREHRKRQVAEHAELVAVFDMGKRSIIAWTGKSYPTMGQERTLVHVIDLDSHLVDVAGERRSSWGATTSMMYNPRGHAEPGAGRSPTGSM